MAERNYTVIVNREKQKWLKRSDNYSLKLRFANSLLLYFKAYNALITSTSF